MVVMIPLVYSELDRQTCQERGFNSESLQCSSCADLPQFHLDELVDDCNSCCRNDYVEMEQAKYPRAYIEICECNLGRFPQAEGWSTSFSLSYPNNFFLCDSSPLAQWYLIKVEHIIVLIEILI
uniref:Selenoprotein F/M domain-containing protein n=1 Tax=Wuchereria bancrofti TaxID=6293 RepID=A0A1I8ETV2_WUCBA